MSNDGNVSATETNKRRTRQFNRRQLLSDFSRGAVLLSASLVLPPTLAFAKTDSGNNKLVVIILRGGMDGLAAVCPYGDKQIKSLRAPLLPVDNEIIRIDNYFGFHPALANTAKLYQQQELAVCHAVASPYRERSHFDAQNVIEIGLSHPDANADGWLNRLLSATSGSSQHPQAIAVGQAVPLMLRGSAEVMSWTPPILPTPSDATMEKLLGLYAHDTFLGPKLVEALEAQNMVGDEAPLNGMAMRARLRGNNQLLPSLVDACVKFLRPNDGPNIAVVEDSGWDTHANQGAAQGQLARKFAVLDQALQRLKDGLATTWRHTAVLVITEFGRTAHVNGTNGTDHGTASIALIAGGAVKGGRVVGDWPGLGTKDLYEGRDLMPTTDLRAVFKSVLRQHLSVSSATLDRSIFPGSADLSELPLTVG